ncbi:hypothetical protein ACLKA6_005547 [Drosophila palustris]
MGNTHNQNRSALTPNGSSALEKSPGSGSLARLPVVGRTAVGPGSGLEERRSSSRTRVLSRLVSQKRVRDVFLQASTQASGSVLQSPTPSSPSTAEWSTPEVEHGQLNANTEQMDFHSNNKDLLELQRRCRADKIACLSLSQITYLSIANEQTEQETKAELHKDLLITPESSPDERMALQLGKKLAQVLGNTSTPAMETPLTLTPTPTAGGATGVGGSTGVSVAVATPRVDSPLGNGELFNISKAKKVELQNLSSRFSAAVSQTTSSSTSTSTSAPEASATSTLTATSTPATTPLETQSTVIISFKSSQTPVQSQTTASSDNAANNREELSEQQLKDIEEAAVEAGPLPPPPGYGTPTNLLLSSNVLKKVASFSVERSSAGNSNSNGNVSNAQLLPTGEEKDKDKEKETTLTATSTETVAVGAGSRRGSSFVPEKLSFAAYEKFEAVSGPKSDLYAPDNVTFAAFGGGLHLESEEVAGQHSRKASSKRSNNSHWRLLLALSLSCHNRQCNRSPKLFVQRVIKQYFGGQKLQQHEEQIEEE